MRKYPRATRGLAVVIMALAAMLMLPLSAFASNTASTANHHKQHTPHFFPLLKHGKKIQATTPFASGNDLNYGGGPVMEGTMNVYAIFWEPTGNVTSSYNNLILRYFGDVGGSGLYNNNTQYTDYTGSAPGNAVLAGSWTDTTPYPSSALQDSDIQNEVTNAQNANGWQSGPSNIFFVFTENNEDICMGSSCASNAFCGYHNYFGNNTIYSAMPYAGFNSSGCIAQNGPNGDSIADAEISITSHEQMEAATDPLLNAYTDSSGQEIGDKCAWNFGNVNPDGSNVNWNGDPYIVQQEYDNAISGCTLSGP
jgi:hypothetical protein